ncbi:hypothetical protein HGI47_18555 [Novosphingobium sp. ERN07]|uniref:hypothetical protein n=1 Tax=Novosphingobium sp. ERN07 TaxID=2726187 RepID=UPI0014573E0B|nr:hypothetical protein [Novosphingobium sp. ERN07]NLR72881.1 hypothetical protein [Novosphingobium sp. ERN07]
MTPDQVRELTARLGEAIHAGDDDASGDIAMQLCCGAALNLARIAEALQAPPSSSTPAVPPG